MVTTDTQKIVKENAKRRDQKRKNDPSKRRRYTHTYTYIYTQNCVSGNETEESEVNVK
jgi:hypothetical protein